MNKPPLLFFVRMFGFTLWVSFVTLIVGLVFPSHAPNENMLCALVGILAYRFGMEKP